MMVFTVFIGVHTLVVPLICSVTMLGVVMATTWDDAFPILVLTATTATVCFQFEYSVAHMYRQLRAERDCNQRLLDSATDGFGVVDCNSGVLLNVSPKMMDSFDCNDMQGQHLESYVDTFDQAALRTFLGVADNKQPDPILITCLSKTSQFEVRLVPYKMDGTTMGFCVQTVGESRSNVVDRVAAPASCHTEGGHLHETMKQHPHIDVDMSQLDPEEPSTQPPELLGVDDPHKHRGGFDVTAKLTEKSLSSLGQAKSPDKRLSTLSLSSWSLSYKETRIGEQGPRLCQAHSDPIGERCEVGTQTVGEHRRRKPPPMPSVLGVNIEEGEPLVQRRADGRRKRSKNTPRRLLCTTAQLSEDKVGVRGFSPTPLHTQVNALSQLASRLNVAGVGCCSKHIVWTAILRSVSEELRTTCGQHMFYTAWQCPECLALNEWDDLPGSSGTEQLCAVCGGLVLPRLRVEQVSSESEIDVRH